MGSRLELHEKLKEKLGSNNVYYQPPSTIQMKYQAIRYSKENIDKVSANNHNYLLQKRNQVTVIDKMPDNPVIENILNTFPHSTYDRHYTSDNLNHDVLTLYY